MTTDDPELWARWWAGDMAARDALVAQYAAFAYYQVSKIGFPPEVLFDREDIRSAALIGLVEAVERWRPSGGASFLTFAAQTIGHRILDEKRRCCGDVRTQKRSPLLFRPVSSEQVAEEQPGCWEQARSITLEDHTADRTLLEVVIDRDEELMLGGAVAALPEAEARVVRLYYREGRLLKEIGQDMGLSVGRISQILHAALGRMRETLTTQEAMSD